MTRRLFVLLPPSQAKGSGGSRNTKVGTFDATLELARRQVVMALGALVESGRPKVIEKTLQVQGPLLERAIESTRALVEQRALWLPAWRRYTGVVWVHLDPATLTPTQRRRVLIPSALYGVTTAQDYVCLLYTSSSPARRRDSPGPRERSVRRPRCPGRVPARDWPAGASTSSARRSCARPGPSVRY